MKRHFFALLMSLTMVISLLPVTAMAKNETQENEAAAQTAETPVEPATSGDCGATEDDHVKWSFDSRTGVLTISGTGAIMDDPANKKNWSDVVSQISEVRIDEGITSIGGNLIRNMQGATVYIPKSVTEIKHSNEQAAFNNGYDVRIVLDSANENYVMEDGVLFTADKKTLVKYTMDAPADYTVPDGVETIAAKGFGLISKLESVSVPEGVTTLGNYAFQLSSNLKEFTFPDSVTTIGSYLFMGSGIERLKLGHGLTEVHANAFDTASKLNYVFISNTITTLNSRAFRNTALTEVEFEDNSVLETIGTDAFAGCAKLESIELPASVRVLGESAFNGCSNLSEIKLNEGLTKIEHYAFKNCDALLDIEVPSTITNVDQIGSQLKGFYSATVYANVLNTSATWHGILPVEHNGSSADKVGWYGENGTFYNVGSNRTEITEKTKVYAVYSAETVFDANGGEGDLDSMTSYYAPGLSEGATITLANKTCKLPANTFTKADHIFIGWNTKADGTGVSYADEAALPAGKEPVETLYAQWGVKVDEDTYFVYPSIADQTYTGSALEPAVKVTKNGEVISDTEYSVKYSSNTNVGTATATVKVDDTVIGTATFNIVKATPTLTITASPNSLRGGGKVTLTVSGVPSSEGTAAVTCDNGISVTKNEEGTYSASLPNRTATYTFTLSYTGATDGNYNDKTTTCEVSVTRHYSSSTTVTPEPTPEPAPEETVKFSDVSTSAYYYDAVKWAVENGVTDGVSATLFAPYEPCTRGQIVTFLWRAVGSPEPKTASSFADVPASAYYAKAVAWAVENGITNGMTDTDFAPDATCTRGQSVTFLYRALKGTASGSTSFTDVPADAFYADAVSWAVANKVTDGTSATTFSPNADCTRAEIVTFLYRADQAK